MHWLSFIAGAAAVIAVEAGAVGYVWWWFATHDLEGNRDG